MGNFIDLTGQRFGRLTVISRADTNCNKSKGKSPMWNCVCDCGNTVTTSTRSLRSGHTKSCGCLKVEKFKKMALTHGESKTRLYKIWKGMHTRCYNKNREDYKNYGLRGIKICESWKTNFLNFKDWAIKNGYSDNLSIDRIDVNKDYCPENCRWVCNKVQQRNKTVNHLLTVGSETKTISEWAEITGIDCSTIRQRVNLLGWDAEKAIKTPVRKKKEGD